MKNIEKIATDIVAASLVDDAKKVVKIRNQINEVVNKAGQEVLKLESEIGKISNELRRELGLKKNKELGKQLYTIFFWQYEC